MASAPFLAPPDLRRPGPLINTGNTISQGGPLIHQGLVGTPDNPYIHQALVSRLQGPLVTTPNTISQSGPLINTGQEVKDWLVNYLKQTKKVPGAGLGVPTADQQTFLDAIHHSSVTNAGEQMIRGRVYRPFGQGVSDLEDAIGSPVGPSTGVGPSSYQAPRESNYSPVGNILQYLKGEFGWDQTGWEPGSNDPITESYQRQGMAEVQRFFQGTTGLGDARNTIIDAIKRGSYDLAHTLMDHVTSRPEFASDFDKAAQGLKAMQTIREAGTYRATPWDPEAYSQAADDFMRYMTTHGISKN